MIEMTSDRLTRLICGTQPKSRSMAERMVNSGLMSYAGGFQDDYSWDVVMVGALPDEQKEALLLELEADNPMAERLAFLQDALGARQRIAERAARRAREGRPPR